jgi:hypothetical protein
LCAPAALWAVDVGQAGRLGQAEADLVDQSAVVAVVPVVPVDQSAVVAVVPVVPAVVDVDPVDQPQAQARQSQTEDLS